MSLINNKKYLIYAALAGLFVFVGFTFITIKTTKTPVKKAPEFQYVAAKTAIEKDALIKEEDVEIKAYAIEIDGAYKATGEVIGRKTKEKIEEGKLLVKDFIQEIKVIEDPKSLEPAPGFRAVPILIRKSSLPPYISKNDRFDLFTKENSMRIENLKILNITDTSNDSTNKMLILEIKNGDVNSFIKNQTETKGFVFIQKNREEYGEYRFYDGRKRPSYTASSLPSIPSIGDLGDLPSIGEIRPKNEVEVIVGSTKTKVGFDD